MANIEDPIVVADREIADLIIRLREAKTKRTALLEERQKWPKLVKVSVSQGECGDEMLEAFAAACGWIAEENNTGTYGWTYIGAQAWLYYEVTENGRVTLVGAWDQTAGAIGKTDVAADKSTTRLLGRDERRDG